MGFSAVACRAMSEPKLWPIKTALSTPDEAMNLATQAADIRFGKGHRVDVSQLLNVVREEDKGDDDWTVFNRIQENLTQYYLGQRLLTYIL